MASPFGPCYISRGWDVTSDPMPALVTVVVTRRLPTVEIAAGVAMVDRTCMGVKNGFVARPLRPGELERVLPARIGLPHGGMVRCDLLVAQSVVYHAIDYARRLSFEPHPDFPERLFGPRPAELIETPLCNVAKPQCLSGPDDDVPAVLARLDATVGQGNYDFTVMLGQSPAAREMGVLSVGGDAWDEDGAEDADEEEDR